MRKLIRCAVLGWVVALSCFLVAGVLADDHHGSKEGHERESHKHHGEKGSTTPPATNQPYKDSCGACHPCYPPGLLPSGSWAKILGKLDDHFGQSVDINAQSQQAIGKYLADNAAERSPNKVSSRIMTSLGGTIPLRITQIPYIIDKHRRISPDVFSRKSIGSLANCSACHRSAEQGAFDKHGVVIPK